MSSPIDKMELLLGLGVQQDVRLSTLADVGEVASILSGQPDLSTQLCPLDIGDQAEYRRMQVFGESGWRPVHLNCDSGELREFDPDWSGPPHVQFKMRFKKRLVGVGVPPQHADLICGAFDEMIGNAKEHSECSVRSIATFEVTARWWVFGVTDFGIGIPDRLRQNPSHEALDDLGAIETALQPGVSTLRDVGRGFGFHQILRVLAEREAKIRIRAGVGLAEWTGLEGGTGTLNLFPKPDRRGSHVRVGGRIRSTAA